MMTYELQKVCMCKTFIIWLRAGPQNDAWLKPVRRAKKVADPSFDRWPSTATSFCWYVLHYCIILYVNTRKASQHRLHCIILAITTHASHQKTTQLRLDTMVSWPTSSKMSILFSSTACLAETLN